MRRNIWGMLILLGGLLFSTSVQAQNENTYWEIGSSLYPLEIITTQNKTIQINKQDLASKHHFFLVMFSPACGHCEDMTKMILRNASLFKKSKVVFMTDPKMKADIPNFIKETGIDKYPQFIVGVDNNHAINKLYSYGTLPQINVYNNKGILVKTLKGDNPIEVFKSFLP